MNREELRRIAEERRTAVRNAWKVVGRLGMAAATLSALVLTRLETAPSSLWPSRENLGTYLVLGALVSLVYLYVVRPLLRSFLEAQAPSEARSPKAWQYGVLTTAIEKHGLTGAFTASVGADVVAYATLGAGAWALTDSATGSTLWFLRVAAGLAVAWAAMYGLARVVPRRSFAETHGFIRWVESGLVHRIQGRASDVPLTDVSDPTFRMMIQISAWRKRITDALFVASCVYLGYLLVAALPPDMSSLGGITAASAIFALFAVALISWRVLAWARSDRSGEMLGQLEYAVRTGEITELEAHRAFLVIEILRANHVHPPGGLNQIFEIAATARAVEAQVKNGPPGEQVSGDTVEPS